MTILKQSVRRKELVETAAKLFKENSFDRTTVRMIASEANIQSGSLFHHFSDKEEILKSVIEHGLKNFMNALQKEVIKKTTVEDRLRRLIYLHLKTLHGKNRDAYIVSVTEWRALSEPSKQHLIELRDQFEHVWQVTIEQAVSEKLISGDPKLTRLFLLGAMNWSIQWFQPKGEKNITDLSNELYELITQ